MRENLISRLNFEFTQKIYGVEFYISNGIAAFALIPAFLQPFLILAALIYATFRLLFRLPRVHERINNLRCVLRVGKIT